MKVNQNGREIEADEIRVDRYYIHESSRTKWKVHTLQATPIGYVVDIELVNEYGDRMNTSFTIQNDKLFAHSGKFSEITKAEFDR
jgi:hypothetical protein